MADADLPRIRRTQAERSDAMRRRLIDAAAQVVHQRGFAGLRMAEVAEVASVSTGAQLHHFPTKKALILALFEHLYGSMAEASKARQGDTATLPETIRGLIADSREFFLGEGFQASLDIALGATRDADLRGEVLEIIARYRTGVEAMWTDRLIAFGIARPQAVDALWLVNSTLRGLAVRAIWDRDTRQYARLEALVERLLVADLAAQPAGRTASFQ